MADRGGGGGPRPCRSTARIEDSTPCRPATSWCTRRRFSFKALLVAMLGRFDEGRRLRLEAEAILEDLHQTVWRAAAANQGGKIELLAGDPIAAERSCAKAFTSLEGMGEQGYLSTIAGLLARAVFSQGRIDEAEGSRESVSSQVTRRISSRSPYGGNAGPGSWRSGGIPLEAEGSPRGGSLQRSRRCPDRPRRGPRGPRRGPRLAGRRVAAAAALESAIETVPGQGRGRARNRRPGGAAQRSPL